MLRPSAPRISEAKSLISGFWLLYIGIAFYTLEIKQSNLCIILYLPFHKDTLFSALQTDNYLSI